MDIIGNAPHYSVAKLQEDLCNIHHWAYFHVGEPQICEDPLGGVAVFFPKTLNIQETTVFRFREQLDRLCADAGLDKENTRAWFTDPHLWNGEEIIGVEHIPEQGVDDRWGTYKFITRITS